MKKWVIAALSVFMAICSSAAEPVHRETLTSAINREPKTLIPYESNDTGTDHLTILIYDRLLNFDRNMKLIPALAKSWEIVDPTHYRFHLRDDVKFHDGTPLTAKDVVYSFKKSATVLAAASVIGPVDVENCKAEDDYTVLLVLKRPFPPFLNSCALSLSSIVCMNAMEADPQRYAQHPVGSGPLKFEEWATGDYLRMNANTEWWGGKLNYDTLMLRIIPEATTRAIEVESGGADIAHITVNQVQDAQENGDVQLLVQPILNVSYLSFNCSIKPFNNVKVRQAISCAIDADAIVKAAYFGLSERSYSSIAPTVWGYYNTGEPYGYNVERAKQLLAEAGYPDGFSCTMISNANQSIAEMIQAYLAAVGIDVTLNVTDFSNWLDAIVNGRQQMYIGGWTVPSADAAEGLAAFKSSNFGSAGNRSFYKNEKVDELLDAADVEMDPAKRADLYKQVQEILAEDAVYVQLNVGTNFYVYSKSVQNFTVLPTQGAKYEEVSFTK